MATVRTTAPRQDPDADARSKSNKKRKRSVSKPKARVDASIAPTATLATDSTNNSSSVSPHVGGDESSTGLGALEELVRRKMDVHSKWQLCTQMSTLCVCGLRVGVNCTT